MSLIFALCTYTCASVTKQYNLLPANGHWCLAAGKVTLGRASHWPRVTDISGSPTMGSRPRRGRWAPAYALLVEYSELYLTFTETTDMQCSLLDTPCMWKFSFFSFNSYHSWKHKTSNILLWNCYWIRKPLRRVHVPSTIYSLSCRQVVTSMNTFPLYTDYCATFGGSMSNCMSVHRCLIFFRPLLVAPPLRAHIARA